MALAAALMAAKGAVMARHDVASPEVLLPAYACPDLVSAALYAGFKPVLVDLEADTPWMDLEKLREQINSNTVAVIAVHFLGIPERLLSIRKALHGSAALLIEDSAQLFPAKSTDGVWEGDLVTLSFGRGKPVSLLGGGAVLSQESALNKHLPLSASAAQKGSKSDIRRQGILANIKVHLYNYLLSPDFYGVLQRAPFINLGETIYKPLRGISPFGADRRNILAANIISYCLREREQEKWLASMLKGVDRSCLSDLTVLGVNRASLPLLRYPLLLKDQSLRDRLFRALSRAGLGVSKMYPKPLSEIEGLKYAFTHKDEFTEAKSFSQRLLTLPCHSGVSYKDVECIEDFLKKIV
jgi:dTDP-4-amino-4,6-dideoxygalactose transaminase